MKKINVAIDGPSGSGKSTAAKAVAMNFNYMYVNTGLVYRATALYAINNKLDETKIIDCLEKINIILKENEIVILNEVDVTKDVRLDKVSQMSSRVASIPEVRKWALKILQDKGQEKGIVMDGRDTTFRVLPNAELKIFLDTSAEVRAQRRVDQNKELGFNINYKEILEEIKIRDHRDRTRKSDPLHKTDDAILIDSSNMNLQEVIDKVIELVEQKLK